MARQPAPLTQRSTPRLSEAARHLVIPKGIVSTGWPAVRDTCMRFKVTFDPWQDGAGSAILGKRKDRLYAADAVVISIPRQVGKTYLIGWVIFALCIISPGTLALWTAHRFATANDTFNDLKSIAERSALKSHVKRITTAADNKAIEFRNGSRVLFGARERGFGRGFKKVAILVFDEAQILTENAIDDMIPATNQAENPLVVYIGTPPKPSDPGDVFTSLRDEAISGQSDSTLYIEMSADEGADPNDREQWAKANASYPVRTTARAFLRMRKHLTPESFMREALGIWDGTATVGVFSSGSWARLAVTTAPPPVAGLGVASDLDQVWLSLGAASDGDRPHLGSVMRVRLDRERATFISETKRIQVERSVPVGIDVKGPASFLIPDLVSAGVRLTRASLDDYVQACADLRAAVDAGKVEHGNYEDLNAAVDAAGWRKVGEGRRAIGRKHGDVSSLESVALALWAAGQDTTSVYESRELVTL